MLIIYVTNFHKYTNPSSLLLVFSCLKLKEGMNKVMNKKTKKQSTITLLRTKYVYTDSHHTHWISEDKFVYSRILKYKQMKRYIY